MKALLLLLALPFLQGCSEKAQAQTATAPAGRYTIVFSPRVERDTFLIDGATGRTWQLAESKDGEALWQTMRKDP